MSINDINLRGGGGLIWLKAAQAAGMGFLAEIVLGGLYGIVAAIIGADLNLYVMLVILFLAYLFTGLVAARRSETPLTAAGTAGFMLALGSLLLTRLAFGRLFFPAMFPIGVVLTFGISMLGAVFYRLVILRRPRDESLEG